MNTKELEIWNAYSLLRSRRCEVCTMIPGRVCPSMAISNESCFRPIYDYRMNMKMLVRIALTAGLSLSLWLSFQVQRKVFASSDGLIAACAFDEGSGITAMDASGNNNTAILMNAATWAPGHSGSAVSFDGDSGYVMAGNITALNGLTAVTVSAWVRGSVGASSPDAFVVGKDQAFALVVGLTAPHKAQFAVKAGGTWYGFPSSITSVDDGAFHFLTGVYDGTTLYVYVDGVLEGSQNIGGLTLNSPVSNLEIASCVGGSDCDVSGEMWQGLIDDVRIYNRALSAAEIVSDMNAPVSNPDLRLPFP